MSDLLKRIEGYSDPDRLFELDDFTDVADMLREAKERIAELEDKLAQQGNYKIVLEASRLVRELQEDRIAKLEGSLVRCHDIAGCEKGNCKLEGDECWYNTPQAHSQEVEND